MRVTGLLALLLFVLIIFFAAPAASYAQTAAIASNPSQSDSLTLLPEKSQPAGTRVSEHPLVATQPLLEHNGDLVLRESMQESPLGDEFTCLKLRTYVVARDDKTSDATHPVRKVNCTPARKFSVKSADIRVKDQNRNQR